MSRHPVPFGTNDLSGFARALARELGETAPSHLSLMNMLARAGGFRNFQHLRATTRAQQRLSRPNTPPPSVDFERVERALSHFDEAGRLARWPKRNNLQKLALWVFWADLPAREPLPESAVNERFAAGQTLNDPATIRRMLVGLQRATRNPDGSQYIRVECEVPPEAVELIRHVRARREFEPAPRRERSG